MIRRLRRRVKRYPLVVTLVASLIVGCAHTSRKAVSIESVRPDRLYEFATIDSKCLLASVAAFGDTALVLVVAESDTTFVPLSRVVGVVELERENLGFFQVVVFGSAIVAMVYTLTVSLDSPDA